MRYRSSSRRSRLTSSVQREFKTGVCHTKGASFASWLVTIVFAIAIVIGVASGEVATKHSVLQPIAYITNRNVECVVYITISITVAVAINNKRGLRYVTVMTRLATCTSTITHRTLRGATTIRYTVEDTGESNECT